MVRTVHMPILGLFLKGVAQFLCGVIPEERDSWDAVCALQGGCLLSCERLLQHISKYSVLSSVISKQCLLRQAALLLRIRDLNKPLP